MSKSQANEYQEALRKQFKPGDTIYTVLRHVSRSGMSRNIDLIQPRNNEIWHLSYQAAKALDRKANNDGIKVSGCGMDMGFALVYELSQALYRDGFDCIGKDCPSNDHTNGDRDYTPHHHKAGGYALRQRWL